jgi:ComF family protein
MFYKQNHQMIHLMRFLSCPPPLLQLKHYWQQTLDIIFPPRCLLCHSLVSEIGALCASCWQKMTFNTPPHCAICSEPFPYEAGEAALCGNCIAKPPSFAKLHTVFHYDEHSKTLIHNLKYGDKTHTARYFGTWMARVGQPSLAQADMLVPVPLHKFRLLRRHFNQAALLAREIGCISGVPVYPQLLLRTRHTPPQAGLSSKERIRNVRGVFKLHPNYATLVKDKHIILIDDVMTTGATLSACAKIVLKAGASKVSILTLAKTIKR